MLRRDKLVASEILEGDNITYYPPLAPNVRITFENDPNFDGITSNYTDNVSFSDSNYDLKGIQTSIIGSYTKLNDTVPNIHSLVVIREKFIIGYTHDAYLLSDETIESLYFYNSDYTLQESLTEPKTITNSNFVLFAGGSDLKLGTHEYHLSKTSIDIKQNIQIPIRLHLDIDFSDDCQYIRVTTIDPQNGQDQYNFEILPNGQNDAGKYLYTIRWWGYFKEPYGNTDNQNICLAYFDPSTQTVSNFQQSKMYDALIKDTDHSQAEMSCIMVTIPLLAKSFDFTTNVECDTTLHMAKYKDILTYTDVTINEDGTITPITI